MNIGGLRRHACLLVGLTMVVLGVAGPAGAPASATTQVLASAEGTGQLLVILDASGSMKRPDPAGGTLISGARKAVRSLVSSVPEDTEVGLRLYGATYSGEEQAKGCRDTALTVPIGPVSSTGDRIERAVGRARPTGFTPIGYSLTRAAGDFDSETQRSVILVSDGEDTCGNPDPCAAARRLAKQGVDVRVDTVGLALDGNTTAERQLRCIAERTGGRYVTADDSNQLTARLDAAGSRAVRSFQVDGTPVRGGAGRPDATPIDAGTDYADTLVNGEARWFSFDAEARDQVAVEYADTGAQPYGCCMSVDLYAPDNVKIGHANTYSRGTSNSLVAQGPTSAAGTQYLEVRLEDTTSTEKYGEVPFQFTVTVDPAEPTETATPSGSTLPSASASPSTGGDEGTSASAQEAPGSGLLWTLVAVLGVLVMGLLVAVLLLWRRLAAIGAGPPGPGS